MDWTNRDTALTIQGVGTLAGAWGQYETNKERNKLAREELDYQKQKDLAATAKYNTAQKNLDNAFDASILNVNKKKKKYDANGNEIVDPDSANGDSATTA